MGVVVVIDFTNCEELSNIYGGSEKKKRIVYNNEIYLVKFPDPIREKNNPLSYMNNQFSEYIGCKIFESIGIPVQSVLLGVFREQNGKQKVVVACKDFTVPNKVLQEFAHVATSTTSIDRKLGNKIEDVYDVIDNYPKITQKQDIVDRFWEMFVVDALIGNKDRHLENWGFLEHSGVFEFSPIYDCGSSLHALLSDEECELLLKDSSAFKNEAYNIHSCYSLQGKRINYAEIFKNPPLDLERAILNVVPKISLNHIYEIVNSTPFLSLVRKEFIYKSIEYRKELILDKSLKYLQQKGLKTSLNNVIEECEAKRDTLPKKKQIQSFER